MVKDANRSIDIEGEADFDRTLKDIGIDSLDFMSILFSAQETYNIEIPDEDIDALQTLNHLASYIAEKQ
jgi:acyl carrier protein